MGVPPPSPRHPSGHLHERPGVVRRPREFGGQTGKAILRRSCVLARLSLGERGRLPYEEARLAQSECTDAAWSTLPATANLDSEFA